MLTALDDTLWHQIADTFDHAGTSDQRFYDRYWFAAYDGEGVSALQFTMGSYLNTDVLDAGFVLVHRGQQYNLRASRALRPRFEPVCEPLAVRVVEPMSEFELVIHGGEQRVNGTLVWKATWPPEEEAPHYRRERGRERENYCRFDQVGTCSGTLYVDGEELRITNWWACRDHSWGVRPRIGGESGIERRESVDNSEMTGYLFSFLFFSTPNVAGHVQTRLRGLERLYMSGLLRQRGGEAQEDARAADITLNYDLHEGTRRFRTASLDVTMEDGQDVTIRCEALGSSIAMAGLGYSGGYRDGRGLGARRGSHHVEHEIWDVSHPADVSDEAGVVFRPWHRIQPVRVSLDTALRHEVGTGSLTFVVPA